MNAAAMALIAGRVCSVGGLRHAKCFSEKRARKRRASGTDSEVSAFRRARIVVSSKAIVDIVSPVAEGVIWKVGEIS